MVQSLRKQAKDNCRKGELEADRHAKGELEKLTHGSFRGNCRKILWV